MDENSRPTQCDRILRHLYDFGTITPMEALKEYGIMRLASRITEIRHKRGIDIKVEFETGKNKYGESCHWAKYSLAKAE